MDQQMDWRKASARRCGWGRVRGPEVTIPRTTLCLVLCNGFLPFPPHLKKSVQALYKIVQEPVRSGGDWSNKLKSVLHELDAEESDGAERTFAVPLSVLGSPSQTPEI